MEIDLEHELHAMHGIRIAVSFMLVPEKAHKANDIQTLRFDAGSTVAEC